MNCFVIFCLPLSRVLQYRVSVWGIRTIWDGSGSCCLHQTNCCYTFINLLIITVTSFFSLLLLSLPVLHFYIPPSVFLSDPRNESSLSSKTLPSLEIPFQIWCINQITIICEASVKETRCFRLKSSCRLSGFFWSLLLPPMSGCHAEGCS